LLEVRHDSFHFRLQPRDPHEELVALLGRAVTTWDEFAQPLLSFFGGPQCPEVRRLGFGAELLVKLRERKEGYEYLQHLLRGFVVVDPSTSEDIIYQVSRPRRARSYDVEINRLRKWSVPVFTLVPVPAGPARLSWVTAGVRQEFGLMLELDINSSADNEAPIPAESRSALLTECINDAKAILENGECA